MADKRLRQVRSVAVRDPRELLFDPEAFREMGEELAVARHTLSREQLLEYGRVATRVRHVISHKHDAPEEESKGELAEQDGIPEQGAQLHTLFTNKVARDDFEERSNPMHWQRKRRTLRELSAAARLEILKLVVSKAMTGEEIAVRYNIKVQLVRDIVKNHGKRPTLFISKKKAELKSLKLATAITSVLQSALSSQRVIWSSKQVATEASA